MHNNPYAPWIDAYIREPIPKKENIMKIGLSLSFCIRDIVEGKVAVEDVRFISAGTCARSKEDWLEVLNSYEKNYWYKQPLECIKLAQQFIVEGRIIQPRLEDQRPCGGGGVYPSYWCDETEYDAIHAKTQAAS